MKDQDIPRQTPDYRLEEFDNELLLYHPVKTQAVYLNEIAALIWHLCTGKYTTASIRNLLQEAYPETPERVGQDVQATLKQFVQCGAIELL